MPNVTDTCLRKLRVDKLTDFADSRVLGLRITARPERNIRFHIRYTFKKKVKRATLGAYPGLSLVDARTWATELLAMPKPW